MHTQEGKKNAEQPIKGRGEENLDQLRRRYQKIKKAVSPKQDPSKRGLPALQMLVKKLDTLREVGYLTPSQCCRFQSMISSKVMKKRKYQKDVHLRRAKARPRDLAVDWLIYQLVKNLDHKYAQVAERMNTWKIREKARGGNPTRKKWTGEIIAKRSKRISSREIENTEKITDGRPIENMDKITDEGEEYAVVECDGNRPENGPVMSICARQTSEILSLIRRSLALSGPKS